MKKSLIALAVLAASGAAMAQSSVTLYGSADVNYTWDNVSGSGAKYRQNSGGLVGSRIGFRGVEDLGNGLKAGFVVETGYNVDSGTGSSTGLGNRQSFLSLAGGFGEVRFGKQYTLNDTFVGNYGGAFGGAWNNAASALTSNGARNQNAATYISPNFSGFKVTGQIATKEAQSGDWTTPAGTTQKAPYSLGLDYANGPVGVGLTAGKNGAAGTKGLYQLGGSYDFGPVALLGAWEYDQNKDKKNTATIGAKVPFGATTLRIAYNYQQEAGRASRGLYGSGFTAGGPSSGKIQGLGIGADYKLSKRSNVYAGASYLKAKNDVFTGGKDTASQVTAGFDHWF
ncbi:MAG: Outer membrane porin protein 32 [Paracidovorax wautersii]|uniref:Outer membrane porin protein 32 n=1 Tax=Paracidovorax wautersii TaxID=1177982 RepID=A0A7V8FSI9_9BURK|nr:MAG: Outer membrane porin protein 32 [Paracidovorax wautersii]